ncbi:MAG: GtrA family protein [Solirubrobacterales bacterium]
MEATGRSGRGSGPARFEAARFFVVSLASLALNITVLEALVQDRTLIQLDAQAIAVALATPFNFLGNKLWTFS